MIHSSAGEQDPLNATYLLLRNKRWSTTTEELQMSVLFVSFGRSGPSWTWREINIPDDWLFKIWNLVGPYAVVISFLSLWRFNNRYLSGYADSLFHWNYCFIISHIPRTNLYPDYYVNFSHPFLRIHRKTIGDKCFISRLLPNLWTYEHVYSGYYTSMLLLHVIGYM